MQTKHVLRAHSTYKYAYSDIHVRVKICTVSKNELQKMNVLEQ